MTNKFQYLVDAGFIHEGYVPGSFIADKIHDLQGVWRIYDAQTGQRASETTDVFAVTHATPEAAIPLVLVCDNPKDILMFAIALKNNQDALDGKQVEEGLSFEHEGTAIGNPFADSQYGKWMGPVGRTPRALPLSGKCLLVDPVWLGAYPGYAAWRDNLVPEFPSLAPSHTF